MPYSKESRADLNLVSRHRQLSQSWTHVKNLDPCQELEPILSDEKNNTKNIREFEWLLCSCGSDNKNTLSSPHKSRFLFARDLTLLLNLRKFWLWYYCWQWHCNALVFKLSKLSRIGSEYYYLYYYKKSVTASVWQLAYFENSICVMINYTIWY